MAESSSQNPSSPKITPKEEPVTLDKPESPNPFLPASQVDFTFDEITFTMNNEVALLYPSHPNQEYFKDVLDFISKCCLNEAFTRALTQYKEYLSEFWYTAKTLEGSKVWVSTLTGGIRGEIGVTAFQNALRAQYLPHSSMYVPPPSITTTRPWFATTGYNGRDWGKGNSKKELSSSQVEVHVDYAKLIWEDLIHKLNMKTRKILSPILVASSGHDASADSTAEADLGIFCSLGSHILKSGVNEESRADDISLKVKLEDLSDILKDTRFAFFTPDSPPALHDFASCLPTELKELPSKITGLSGEIKELKKHVRDMEIEFPRDLKEIPTKLETFTSTISSLLSQREKLKILDSLPSLLCKVTDTLNRFATMVENASGATSMNVPSAGKSTVSPAEGEKNTKDADTNLKDEGYLEDCFESDVASAAVRLFRVLVTPGSVVVTPDGDQIAGGVLGSGGGITRSILTWDDLVSKFINHFFPPSKTTNLRNEISNFQQRFDESFYEAWDRFKDLLRACPHHGFTELHQLDTFYNGLNPSDQDSLNSAAGGNLLERSAQDVLKIIENKSKVRNSRNKPIVSQVKASNVDSSEIASAVTSAMTAMFKQHQVTPAPASVKVVEESCVTCGGVYSYRQFPATDGNIFSSYQDNIQGYVSAAAVNYNQGNTGYHP
ncbi:reverse transcriptase domain-containing protein [Tanacetum coccineum]